jgi:arylamine N-acetyltransferase
MAHSASNTYLAQVPTDPKDRPRYSKEQLSTYFKRIKLPKKYLDSPVLSDPSLARTKEHGVPLVDALTRYHLANVPFENLELHYSAHKTISLNMDNLFEKFAERGIKYGRGGRCMENNGFFGTVLRSLGYELRNCAGRVSRAMSPIKHIREEQGNTYDGWNHMLNLAKFDNEWWIVDVGMGTMGPCIPYPLEDGQELVSIEPRKIRLQKRPIPESHASPTNGVNPPDLWCYDVCLKPPKDGEAERWIPHYCFTETEFLPQDYEMMSWFTSTNKKCFFTYTVVVMRMLLDDKEEKIIGNLTLVNDNVTKNIGAEREVVRELKTEQDRIDALKELFAIELTEEEKKGLEGDLKLQS